MVLNFSLLHKVWHNFNQLISADREITVAERAPRSWLSSEPGSIKEQLTYGSENDFGYKGLSSSITNHGSMTFSSIVTLRSLRLIFSKSINDIPVEKGMG